MAAIASLSHMEAWESPFSGYRCQKPTSRTRPKVDVETSSGSRYKLMMVEIRTERLLLRKARQDDLGAFHDILSNVEAMTFWYRPPHEDLTVTQSWLTAMMEINPSMGEDFAVEFEGRLIGKAGFRRFPTIGFIFHPDVWGRGLAAEATRPIIERAFSVHGLPMIEADVDPRNGSSLRLLNRLGFVETGRATRTSLVGEEWCDSVFLRLHSANRGGN